MRNPEKILLTPKREKRAATASFLIVAALFLLATAQTQFQPFEFLMSMENFWLFIFEDLLPPKIADFGAIAEGILQTVCMAIAASMISAVISLAFAFLGSNTTAPWKPLKKIIRFFASLQRNILTSTVTNSARVMDRPTPKVPSPMPPIRPYSPAARMASRAQPEAGRSE